jgi:hypothetical protein
MNDEELVTSLKFQLGETLKKWLEESSSAAGHSLAEEIRQRLGDSWRFDQDRPTRFLVEEIFLLAQEVKKEIGDNWHENERAKATFVAAVTDHIWSHGKDDEPYRKDPDRVATEEAIIGRTIARLFRRK